MIDWEGLLKFSLQHTDGTHKSDFKEMSEEDKKFLEGAMNEYCNAEIKRISSILEQLAQEEQGQEEERLALLEELQELLDSLDKGTVLYNMNGHIILLRIVFYSKFNSHKNVALQILASANQNDAAVQNQSINCGAMELVDLIAKEQDMRVKENLMSAISALLRGENLEAKRIFIRIGGLDLLARLCEDGSARLTAKIHNLLRDLLHYDDHLDRTFNDLSSFSNTAGLKIDKDHHDLTYDPNVEMHSQNYRPENAKYKGCVLEFLKAHEPLAQAHLKWEQENAH